ncbi:MAG TPA: peptide deformylase [bacterium]|nr:peptide deformylase [bacterium]
MNILLFPNPVLREKSEKIKDITQKTAGLAASLEKLLSANKGCVGIAAPQTGKLQRLVVVDVTGHKKAEQQSGQLILINPEVLIAQGASENREGCLSVPDFTGNVKRADGLRIKYIDIDSNERLLETSGFEAVVIQHEIDHLDGVLFIDRIKNSRRDLFKRKNY